MPQERYVKTELALSGKKKTNPTKPNQNDHINKQKNPQQNKTPKL